jgi:short-subunit dehydrogenase
VHEELHETGVSCTVLCPGPVPTEWADIADAQQWSVGIVQVSPADVAEAAIDGMLEGKRSVVPGLVPKIVGLGGRFTPRSVLLPVLRLGQGLRR